MIHLGKGGGRAWLNCSRYYLSGLLLMFIKMSIPQVFDKVIEGAKKHRAIAGSIFWMTAARSYKDYDGTTIYLTPPEKPDPSDFDNLVIVEAVRKHTIDLGNLNQWCPAS